MYIGKLLKIVHRSELTQFLAQGIVNGNLLESACIASEFPATLNIGDFVMFNGRVLSGSEVPLKMLDFRAIQLDNTTAIIKLERPTIIIQ